MKLTAKVLSVMLVLFVTLSLVPGVSLRAFASGETITLSPTTVNIIAGSDATVTLTAADDSGSVTPSAATWASNDTAVATVEGGASSGTIHGVAAGSTTVSVNATVNGEAASGTVTVNVVNPLTITGENNIDPDSDITLTAGGVSNDESVTWQIDPSTPNSNISLIPNGNGSSCTVHADENATGSVKINASVQNSTPARTASKTITINDTQTSDEPYIDISAQYGKTVDGKRQIEVNQITQLTATVMQDGAAISQQPTSFTWTSSNSSVAELRNSSNNNSNTREVIGRTPGEATITVSTTVGDKTISKTYPVKVVSQSSESGDDDDTATSFTLQPYRGDDMPLYKGKSYPIEGSGGLVEVIPSPEGSELPEIKWSVDPKMAKIDKNGNVTPLKTGKITITAKSKDGKITASRTFNAVGYVCKSGAGKTYVKGSNTILPFVIANSDANLDKSGSENYTYDYFEDAGCQVNVTGNGVSEQLKPGTDFLYAAGSVKLSLLPDYLDTLDPGTYYLTATFDVPEEGYVDSEEIKFIVKKKGSGSGSNPDTADIIYIGLGAFMFLLALTYVALFTYDKKQRKLRLRRRIAAHHRRYY